MAKSLFFAAGHHGSRLTSPDGKKWIPAPLGREGDTYRCAAAGGGRLVAIGSYGGDNIFTSTADGIAWKDATKPAQYSRYIRGLAFGNGGFLAIGGDPGAVGVGNPFVFASADGEKWEGPHDIGGKFILRRVSWGNKRWVGVGDRGRRAASPDGKAWKDAPEVKAVDTLVDVTFGSGVFVGVGLHGLRMRTSDGLTWTDRQTGDEGEHLNSIVWAKDRFVAVGAGATFTSTDGAKWTRSANADAPLTVAYGDGVFVGPRWRGRLMRSTDGIRWEETHRGEQHFQAVTFGAAAK